MLVLENILLALNGLRANKMRSILTMLGIIIGIASVITIMTIGTSLTSSVQNEMEEMGATNITIGVQQKRNEEEEQGGMIFYNGPRFSEMGDNDYISGAMLDDLLEHFSGDINRILRVTDNGSGKISKDNETATVTAKGGNDDYFESEKLEMLAGRCFTKRDQEQARKVVVVSDKVIDNCLKGTYKEALGKKITYTANDKYYHYTIVGVYRFDESNMGYSFSSDMVTDMYMPLLTAFNEAHTKERYSDVDVVAHDPTRVESIMTDIENYMNSRYYRRNKSFEISCFSLSSMLESYTSMLNSMSAAISVIAGISLLVGGIGVMNIMLVSIQERTREIGTRKALGATNSSIRMQFIVEAIVLCIVGGMIGILIGLIAGYIATPLVDEEASFAPPINGILMSVGFSVAVGVFFGYYPANKAAKMNPIDALRYE